VAEENVSATLTVAVPAARVVTVPADSTIHSAIDGTGWVQEVGRPHDRERRERARSGGFRGVLTGRYYGCYYRDVQMALRTRS